MRTSTHTVNEKAIQCWQQLGPTLVAVLVELALALPAR